MSRTIDGITSVSSKNAPVQQFRPYDFGTDAIERQRVSLGQSLIDADFEYGIQQTKWQTHQEIRKTPSFYEIPGTDLVITDVTADGKPTVSNVLVTTTSTVPAIGTVITCTGLSNFTRTADRAEGFFLVTANTTVPDYFASLPAGTFAYRAKGSIAAGSLYTTSTTYRLGGVFNSGNCSIRIDNINQSGTTVTVRTSNIHGMLPGTPICSNNWSGPGVAGVNGNFFVEAVPAGNIFTYTSYFAGAPTSIGGGSIFVQPYSTVTHRPFDGGVLLTPVVTSHGANIVRQSKKVFRYQSGKGLLWSSGTLFCPNNDIARVTASGLAIGSNITIITDVYHGAQVGAGVAIRGIRDAGFNGNYIISSVNDSRSLNVVATSVLGSVTPAFQEQPRFIITNWHGACARAGCFDDQNGLFWEYDGQNIWVVKRSSTFQLAGTVTTTVAGQLLLGNTYTDDTIGVATIQSQGGTFAAQVNPGDVSAVITLTSTTGTFVQNMHCIANFLPGFLNTVYVISVDSPTQITIGFLPLSPLLTIASGTKTPATVLTFLYPVTRFQEQLKVNDKFILRGMTHVVTSIASQGVLTFNPPYRGISNPPNPLKASRVREQRTPQSQFNRDPVDGTGGSGYRVDLTKMQMIGLQYTWYGAGFIDYMIRGSDGNWVYCHRYRQNNVNDEAYMRSGNQPVRYELINEMLTAVSTLNGQITTTTTNVLLNDDTTYWPASGTVIIDSEFVKYGSKGSFALNDLSRSASITYVINDQFKTFTASAATSHASNASVVLCSITCTPSLTHWGSALLMDGSFDGDRGYYFNYANTCTQTLTAYATPTPIFLLRLAPSVSNGIVGNMGDRDLLNRAQILLQKMEVTANRTIRVTGIINPQGISAVNWYNINSIFYQGQPSFTQVSNTFSGGSTYSGGERIFSSLCAANSLNVLDLSNLKELSNGVIGGQNLFPDGPDTLLINVQNLDPGGTATNVIINLYWSEAQA